MANTQNKLIEFEAIRTQRLQEKRRRAERIVLKQMVGIYCVVGPNNGLQAVELLDVSEEGIAFRVSRSNDLGTLSEAQTLKLRLYFNQDTYLLLTCEVRNLTTVIEDGIRYTRVGCLVDRSTRSFEAYAHFVRFLASLSENAYNDRGATSVFYF